MSRTHSAAAIGCLALDIGAESGRAMLGEFEGERLTLSEAYRFPNGPVRLPDGLHWNLLRIWDEIKRSLAQVRHSCGRGLASVGIDTWGVDFGLLDRTGALVANPFHYRDSRTDGMLEEAARRMPLNELYRRTGMPSAQHNTLYQLLSMVVSDALALEIADTFLMTPDLLNYWLSGERGCEFTIATTTQCYNPGLGGWDSAILEAMGIPTRLFPSIIPPGTNLGPLLPYVADEVGVEADALAVIAPACHDTASAVAAVPTRGAGCAWISSGTWSVVGTELDAPVIDETTLKYGLVNEGGVADRWILCRNVMGLWIVQQCRQTWASHGQEMSYDALTDLARQAEPFQAVIDVDDAGFFTPGDMPARIRAYCQRTEQKVPDTRGGIIRCVLESLALKYRWALERLEEVVGQRLEPLHTVGGGSRNTLLNQLTADATGRRVVTGPIEATALGNILMQLLALGEIGSIAEGRELLRHSFSLKEYPASLSEKEEWGRAYELLCDLVEN